MGEVRIGISGWRYKPWRGVFYPQGLRQKDELGFASGRFHSIEINGTFYSLQRPGSFAAWREAVLGDPPPPPTGAARGSADSKSLANASDGARGFVFAVKGPRYITHMKRLKGIEEPLANFFASGVLELGETLGPMLWQFPPNFKFEEGVFRAFLEMLPRDFGEAARAARGHGERMKGSAFVPRMIAGEKKQKLRHAVEIRHESFLTERFIRLLRRENVALVVADTAGLHPYAEDVTADFVYVRLHGAEQIYASGYTNEALDWWAARVKAWREGGEPGDAKRVSGAAPVRKGRDVYVYFDNDIKVRAPFDAEGLMRRLGIESPDKLATNAHD